MSGEQLTPAQKVQQEIQTVSEVFRVSITDLLEEIGIDWSRWSRWKSGEIADIKLSTYRRVQEVLEETRMRAVRRIRQELSNPDQLPKYPGRRQE